MEEALGREAIKDFQPMQPGDVVAIRCQYRSFGGVGGLQALHADRTQPACSVGISLSGIAAFGV